MLDLYLIGDDVFARNFVNVRLDLALTRDQSRRYHSVGSAMPSPKANAARRNAVNLIVIAFSGAHRVRA